MLCRHAGTHFQAFFAAGDGSGMRRGAIGTNPDPQTPGNRNCIFHFVAFSVSLGTCSTFSDFDQLLTLSDTFATRLAYLAQFTHLCQFETA